jgi:hypothetical protein
VRFSVPLLIAILVTVLVPVSAQAQSQGARSFAVKRCNEDGFELRLDPGPFQEAVGSDYAVVLEDGKARVVFVVQDCSEYWVDGEDLRPAQHTNLWVLIEGARDVRPVVGAQVTRPTMTWFSLFHGSTSSRGRQLRLASGTAPESIEGVSLDPPGPQRGGRVTVGADLSYSWNMFSVAPPVRLVGFNHDIVMRNSEGKTVFKQIQGLANVVAGLSKGTLTVVGGSDPRRLIGPGTYSITGISIFPVWARINLGGPPPR